jgi:hypothetical protein
MHCGLRSKLCDPIKVGATTSKTNPAAHSVFFATSHARRTTSEMLPEGVNRFNSEWVHIVCFPTTNDENLTQCWWGQVARDFLVVG